MILILSSDEHYRGEWISDYGVDGVHTIGPSSRHVRALTSGKVEQHRACVVYIVE